MFLLWSSFYSAVYSTLPHHLCHTDPRTWSVQAPNCGMKEESKGASLIPPLPPLPSLPPLPFPTLPPSPPSPPFPTSPPPSLPSLSGVGHLGHVLDTWDMVSWADVTVAVALGAAQPTALLTPTARCRSRGQMGGEVMEVFAGFGSAFAALGLHSISELGAQKQTAQGGSP